MQIHLLPDKTVFIQLAIFLAVLAGLSRFVFKPIAKIIKLRREKTVGLMETALSLDTKAKTKTEEYEKRLAEASKKLADEYGAVKAESANEEARIKNETRVEALKLYQQAMKDLNNSKKEILEEIKGEIPRIADEIIEKVKAR